MKKISRRNFLFAAGLAVTSAALTACSSGSTSTTSVASASGAAEEGGRRIGGTVYRGTSDVLGEFFTPYNQGSLTGYGWPCYQPLAWRRGTMEWEPCLAESWERDDEAFTLTLHLVQNACFSDGSPMTAEDVVFSLGSRKEYGTDSTIGSPTSVEATDDYTVVITWPSFSLSYEDWILNQFIFSKNTFDEKGLDWMLNNMVGTGPYKLTEFIPDVSLTYERNENFWGDEEAAPDVIKFLYMSDSTTMLAAFLGGEIDQFTTADPEVVNQVTAAGFEGVPLKQTAEAQYLAIPLSVDPSDPLSNQTVRQAIYMYGVDWQAMAMGLGGLVGYHTDAIGMSGMTYYDASLEKSSYDLEKAKQMLADAGYPNGFTTTIYTSAPFAAAATVLQDSLKELNITAECEFVDYSLVQSDYIGAKAVKSGICITTLYFPNTPQNDRFVKHINPNATYGASSTQWSDQIKEEWNTVLVARTQEEEDAALQVYVDDYVHTMSQIWPMYNTSTLIFVSEYYGYDDRAFANGPTDPLHIWTTR